MNVLPRLLGGLFQGLLFAILCLVCLGQTAAQNTQMTNPLRKAETSAATVFHQPVEQAAKVPVQSPTQSKPVPRQSPVKQTSYGRIPAQSGGTGFTPPRERIVGTQIIPGTTSEVMDGEIIYEGMPGDMPLEALPDGSDCCGVVGHARGCLIPCPIISLDNVEFSAGVHGFTGPANRGQTGSFGFHEGFNWGAAVPCTNGAFGMQVGMAATQSNLSGAEFTDEKRHQIFVTGGLFRRVDWGLQGGVVVDYLSDDWYASTDLVQLRGEASWVFPCAHELGFWFTSAVQDDTQRSVFSGTAQPQTETWEATDLYAFFYRHRVAAYEGVQARFFAGFTGNSDGLLGSDLRLPLGTSWALEAGFTYLIPEEATGSTGRGHEQESWNVAIGMVWYPGCRSAFGNDYFRPLFNVADNGTFMVDRR